jgi:hypothetical protein
LKIYTDRYKRRALRIWRWDITASCWPWQDGYNWKGRVGRGAPLNPVGPNGTSARFGGGWRYRLGIDVGGVSIMLNLLWGMVRITNWKKLEAPR